ncbi:hypothetical protein QE152_g4143 [Popillia japonica]|uniref:Polyprotein n=1 Tax=Popillia japonica TaxID=7064 RepID=A0AAW1N3F4_POPJA
MKQSMDTIFILGNKEKFDKRSHRVLWEKFRIDYLVVGKVQDRLLRETKLDLTQCVNICKAAELAEAQSKQLSEETNVNMKQTPISKASVENGVYFIGRIVRHLGRCVEIAENITIFKASVENGVYFIGRIVRHLGRCVEIAENITILRRCVCRYKKTNFIEECEEEEEEIAENITILRRCVCRYKKTNFIEECEEEEEGAATDLFVGVIETNTKQVNSVKEWVQKIKIKGSEIECKVDTGAEVNILNMKTVKRLNAKVRTSKIKLKGYNGSDFKHENS